MGYSFVWRRFRRILYVTGVVCTALLQWCVPVERLDHVTVEKPDYVAMDIRDYVAVEWLDHVPVETACASATKTTKNGAVMSDTYHRHHHAIKLLGPLLLPDEGYISHRPDLPISAFCAGDTGNIIVSFSLHNTAI